MPAPPSILTKVKLLLNLASSPNPNEADNARAMADKLISKYNITEEELSSLDPKEYYGENEKLFVTFGVVMWRQQLAVAVAKYFDCQIVQEELRPAGGEDTIVELHHYVYGDDDQVKDTQFVYHAFAKKIDNFCDTRCIGRGPIYLESYCEGVVESVKWNIEMYGIDIPEIKKPIKKQEEKSMSIPTTGIIKSGDKEEPVDNKRKNIDGTLIKDVMAYFKGIDDGKNLSFKEVLELAVQVEESPQIAEGEKPRQ
jgi:hypothetical protein